MLEALHRAGHEVRVWARASSDVSTLHSKDVEVRRGSLLDEDALAAGMQGCDAVLHAAGGGKVLRIAPTIDASTGTVKVTVSMPPAATAAQSFLPGMYAEVTLTTDSRSDVLLVPKAAVVRDEEQTYLFTLAGDAATGFTGKRVRVETGLTDPERIEIVKGLGAGEPVILAGQTGLKDGAKVVRVDAQGKPIDAAPATAPAAPAGDVLAKKAE